MKTLLFVLIGNLACFALSSTAVAGPLDMNIYTCKMFLKDVDNFDAQKDKHDKSPITRKVVEVMAWTHGYASGLFGWKALPIMNWDSFFRNIEETRKLCSDAEASAAIFASVWKTQIGKGLEQQWWFAPKAEK